MTQELISELPKVANELRSLTWLLGGGMSLLILRAVFEFIKTWKKESNTTTTNTTTTSVSKLNGEHATENIVSHALQTACLGRMETSLLAQTASLIEVTSALRLVNNQNNRRTE
jgi:hypothetical protein